MPLTHIDPRYLDTVWPQVSGQLSRALKTNKGEETLDQVRLKVVQGHYSLLVHTEGDDIETVVIAEFIDHPNTRIAHLAYVAKTISPAGLAAFREWAKTHGASQMQAFCADAQSRLFKRYGFTDTYHVMRVAL